MYLLDLVNRLMSEAFLSADVMTGVTRCPDLASADESMIGVRTSPTVRAPPTATPIGRDSADALMFRPTSGPVRRRRSRLSTFGLVGVTSLALLGLTHTTGTGDAAAADGTRARSKPNIIVIVTDDMRADELDELPTVRTMQRQGVTFTNAISADSLCCPARATLVTGKHAHNHETIGNSHKSFGGYQWFARRNNQDNILPQWMNDAGYRTAYIGKYLNGFGSKGERTLPDWNYVATPVEDVYDYLQYVYSINGTVVRGRTYREVYNRNLLLRRIQRWGPGRKPYFVLYASLTPHTHNSGEPGSRGVAPVPQRWYKDTVPAGSIPRPPSARELDLSDKPRWVRAWFQRRGYNYNVRLAVRRIEALRSVNDTVTQVRAKLRRQGELRNTLIVFTSDNGYMLGEHTLGSKNKPYHESIRVPLVLSGPEFRGGVRRAQTVNLSDVVRTVMTTAGIPRSERHQVDGLPLQGRADSPTTGRLRPTVIEGSTMLLQPKYWELPHDRIGRFYWGATLGRWTYVRYATGEGEFYNRQGDRYEMENLYRRKPGPRSAQYRLRRWAEQNRNCVTTQCDRVW